jgi:hypothetical protein
VNHVQILENECEFALWVKIDGKVFNLEQPVIFGTIYIPPEYTRISPIKPTYLELVEKECNSCSIWLKASSEEYLVYSGGIYIVPNITGCSKLNTFP